MEGCNVTLTASSSISATSTTPSSITTAATTSGWHPNYTIQCTPPLMPIPVKKVIFHEPATVVYWADGTKTVVKCKDGERFDQYYGFCAALAKKVYGTYGEARHAAGIHREREKRPRKRKRDG